MDVTHDGALGDRRLRGVEVGQWPVSRLLRSEFVLALARELAATVRDSILRRSSSLFPGAKIHVSRMSLTWLRVHESEYDKHRAEL